MSNNERPLLPVTHDPNKSLSATTDMMLDQEEGLGKNIVKAISNSPIVRDESRPI